jgi:transposase InsO family protein
VLATVKGISLPDGVRLRAAAKVRSAPQEIVALLRVLTDRGSEFCGNPERHEYELYLAVDDIDHSRTKTKSPQTKGICEGFHETVLNEFYRVAFRKRVYRSVDELQGDLDAWIKGYNEARPHP